MKSESVLGCTQLWRLVGSLPQRVPISRSVPKLDWGCWHTETHDLAVCDFPSFSAASQWG